MGSFKYDVQDIKITKYFFYHDDFFDKERVKA